MSTKPPATPPPSSPKSKDDTTQTAPPPPPPPLAAEPEKPVPTIAEIAESALNDWQITEARIRPARRYRTPQERYPRLFRLFTKLAVDANRVFESEPTHPAAADMDDDDVYVDYHLTIIVNNEKAALIRGSHKLPLLLSADMRTEALAAFNDTLRLNLSRPAQVAFQKFLNKRLTVEPITRPTGEPTPGGNNFATGKTALAIANAVSTEVGP